LWGIEVRLFRKSRTSATQKLRLPSNTAWSQVPGAFSPREPQKGWSAGWTGSAGNLTRLKPRPDTALACAIFAAFWAWGCSTGKAAQSVCGASVGFGAIRG